KTGLNYNGKIKIRNILDFLANRIRPAAISSRITKTLESLKAVCYYGCLNTRVPRMKSFDTVDYPMAMDRLVELTGAQSMDWSYKTECCGGSLFLTAEEVSGELVSKILKDAEARGANCIVTACPMCQSNLDTKQEQFRAQYGIDRPIPVIFITQLLGVAFGIDDLKLQFIQNFVPFNHA
ncbi:MAG: heterodisulfide reductase subunit B, partial [Fibrobacteria bacterium]|nr:heterodisulfide reductase subunit B [Fibrobacteria bacterium]